MNDPEAFQRACRRVAENRIREAQREGAFDDLPGSGRPAPEIEANTSLEDWIREWFRRERLADRGSGRG